MASWKNTTEAYGIIAQALHWLVAALVLVQLPLGLYAANLPLSLARLQWLSRHKSLGIAILAIVLARSMWRSLNRPPATVAAMPRWQRSAAHTTHWLLYVFLLATPVTGWLHASASGLSVNWFGWFQVPDLVAPDPGLATTMKSAHHLCVAMLALLAAGHVGAALWHAFRGDGVLGRMLPWKSRSAL